jgi:hypothetical protein
MSIWALTIFLAASPAEALQANEDYAQSLVRGNAVVLEIVHCLENQSNGQMAAQGVDATPSSIVDAAIRQCSNLKMPYIETMTSSAISHTTATRMADQFFSRMRTLFVDRFDKRLSEPDIADARMEAALEAWSKCVSDKAVEQSALQDDVSTAASAAVTACASLRPTVEATLSYDLKSKSLPGSGAEEAMKNFERAVKDQAVKAVILERAKNHPAGTGA